MAVNATPKYAKKELTTVLQHVSHLEIYSKRI